MLKSFRDYAASREVKLKEANGLGDKPKIALVADYDGPTPTAPPTEKGGKAQAPYRCANGNEKPEKVEKGMADLGDKNLVVSYDTKLGPSKLTTGGKELASPMLSKTEQFLAQTKGMNPQQFSDFMSEQKKVNYDKLPKMRAFEEGDFQPHPSDAIRYVGAVIEQNGNFAENLVGELRHRNILTAILKEAFEFPESFKVFADMLLEDESKNLQFEKAVNEAVGPPFGVDDEEETPPEGEEDEEDDEEEDEEDPFADDDEEEEDDEEEDDEEEGDEDPFANDDDEELGPPMKKPFGGLGGGGRF